MACEVPELDSARRAVVHLAGELSKEAENTASPADVLGSMVAKLRERLYEAMAIEHELFERFGFPEARIHAGEHHRLMTLLAAGEANLSGRERLRLWAAEVEAALVKHLLVSDKKFTWFLIDNGHLRRAAFG